MGRKYSAAQNKATQKYIKSAYDTISLRVRKGEKEDIQEHADGQGESMNAFINRAISEQMERDKFKDALIVENISQEDIEKMISEIKIIRPTIAVEEDT